MSAVSTEYGLEGWYTQCKPVRAITFVPILQIIVKNDGNGVIILDNDFYHKVAFIRNTAQSCGLELVYNVSQTPELNAIENSCRSNLFQTVKNLRP